jgi:hypothetical protein
MQKDIGGVKKTSANISGRTGIQDCLVVRQFDNPHGFDRDKFSRKPYLARY